MDMFSLRHQKPLPARFTVSIQSVDVSEIFVLYLFVTSQAEIVSNVYIKKSSPCQRYIAIIICWDWFTHGYI